MTRLHVCSSPGCPELVSRDRPCPRHGRPLSARWTEGRDGAAQNRFSRTVLAAAGGVCMRCRRASATVAHHIRPGYAPSDGIALCDACHADVDEHARARSAVGR